MTIALQGTHVVCAKVTQKFLEFSKSKGNDLITPVPGYQVGALSFDIWVWLILGRMPHNSSWIVLQFPGLKEGDSWCLCAVRWKEALDDSEDVTPMLYLDATNTKATRFVFVTEEDLKAHAVGGNN